VWGGILTPIYQEKHVEDMLGKSSNLPRATNAQARIYTKSPPFFEARRGYYGSCCPISYVGHEIDSGAGARQVFSAVAGRSHPAISMAKFAKDIGLGMAKIAYPHRYRRNSTVKLLNKL